MQQASIELGALAAVDTMQSYLAAKASRVSRDCFEVYPHIWDFFEEYTKENTKSIPSRELLKIKFNLVLPEKKDDAFYIKELLRSDLRKRTAVVIQNAANLVVDDKPPEEVVSFLMNESSHLRFQKRLNRSVTDGDALRRFDLFNERASGVSLGLSTGFVFNDDQLLVENGNLMGIVGNTAAGKSWILQHIACNMYYQNKAKVVFISPEMTIQQLERRRDSIMANLHNIPIPNKGLYSGKEVDIKE